MESALIDAMMLLHSKNLKSYCERRSLAKPPSTQGKTGYLYLDARY